MADIIQVKNPRTNRYVKIDRDKGRILSHKGLYCNIHFHPVPDDKCPS
jgi:hypothetical protein